MTCPHCESPTRKHGKNPAGGQRYQCLSCRKIFSVGGPGQGNTPIPSFKVIEFMRLIDSGLSIRKASLEVGIAKRTGQRVFYKIQTNRSRMMARELERLRVESQI